MTSDEADDAADWKSMDGGEAFALIERHANDFDDANELMNAWARTRVKAEREACAAICDEYAANSSNPMNFSENCAAAIRARGEK